MQLKVFIKIEIRKNMQANHDDARQWDDSRQCYVDRYGYPISSRASIYKAPTGMDTLMNKIMVEPTLGGTRLRSSTNNTNVEVATGQNSTGYVNVGNTNAIVYNNTGGALIAPSGGLAMTWSDNGVALGSLSGTLVMNMNEIRLQGVSDANYIKYSTTNNNTEIGSFNGGRFVSNGATTTATWDTNGFQARKYMRSSGAFSALVSATRTVNQNERKLLFLGTMTNAGVSGSAWTSSSIDGGTVLTAPFTGTVRGFVRIYCPSPNSTMNYCFFRVYHPTNDTSFTDGDEGLSLGGVSVGDIRGCMFSLFTVNAGERIGVAVENLNTSKNYQILDYHFEYIA